MWPYPLLRAWALRTGFGFMCCCNAAWSSADRCRPSFERRQRMSSAVTSPFIGLEIVDLALAEEAEALAHVLGEAGAAEHFLGIAAIGPEDAPHIAGAEERIVPLHLGDPRLDLVMGEIAAGQCRGRRPRPAHLREERRHLFHDRFGELAEGGDLAAEHRKQRRLASRRFELQHIVARCFLRLAGAVVIERPDARIGPAHLSRG